VGKSTLINLLLGKHAAKTADRPGITRAPQWIRIGHNLELLDTPGLIPPKLENQQAAIKMALTGGIGSEAYDPDEVATEGLRLLSETAPLVLARYGNPSDLDDIARFRNFLLPGGLPNRERAAKTLLSELRQGTAGPMTLDLPPEMLQKAAERAIIGSKEKSED
jgi:ribosome biogenesis GTPase A